ncbi:hypothetical protein LINPERHAP1_LOCUS16842 [Linum perenne]
MHSQPTTVGWYRGSCTCFDHLLCSRPHST